ncbi:IS66-like element accessory protein TnpA [Propionivibrio limicola]|uniref:IS66-like element accessory protein TnpA n=1 Tax=Propionivibrio limicola TaxID=167645 RepID=UPI001478401C|nr:transposase [Propionivibrio limicola]
MDGGRTRRTHSHEFKRSVVEASRQPGASIAGVARAHGLHTNLLQKWRRQYSGGRALAIPHAPALLPVTVVADLATRGAGEAPSSGQIDIELGRVRVSLSGRVDLDVLHTVLVTLRPR